MQTDRDISPHGTNARTRPRRCRTSILALLTGMGLASWAGACSDDDSASNRDAQVGSDASVSSDAGPTGDGGQADAWQPPPSFTPPIGIPAPDFGIEEKAPEPPEPWTQPAEGFYYVDNQHATATDDDNPQGTPDKPRLTIPTDLQPGDVVEIHGGPYDRSLRFTCAGTADQPIFVRGTGRDDMPVISSHITVRGSYLIFEFLDLDGADNGLSVSTPSDHVAVRFCEVRNGVGGPASGLYTGRWNPEDDPDVASHVLFYANRIHDNGDWHSDHDEDHHAVAVGHHSEYVWILDNEMYHNSGDGVQVNAKKSSLAHTLHHVYIGRNLAWENKQTGFWSKQATDVIISQNEIWGMRPSNSSEGSGLGFQYAPERVWFIYNVVHDCENGLKSSTNVGDQDGLPGIGQDIYIVGNVFYDIHRSDGSPPDSNPWQYGVAIRLTDQDERKHIVANTLFDADVGLTYARGTAALDIHDNIFASLAGAHIIVETSEAAQDSTTAYNLFDGRASILWGDNDDLDLAAFQAAQPGQCEGCIEAAVQFEDPDNANFQLQAGSPGVDQGADADVYDTFESLYGISIRVDFTATTRPQGDGYDMGAYER